MFSSIGWGEIVVLAVAALFIFGPERLPHLARDAGSGLKRARAAMTGVRAQVHDTLGQDFDHLRDLDIRRYHPKTLIREHLMGEEDDRSRSGTGDVAESAALVGSATGSRDRSTPPPVDLDAT